MDSCKAAVELAFNGEWDTRAAQEHFSTCPDCKRRFDNLVRAGLGEKGFEISCAECVARLPEYLDDPDMTQEYFKEVEAHLAVCPVCKSIYDHLLDCRMQIDIRE